MNSRLLDTGSAFKPLSPLEKKQLKPPSLLSALRQIYESLRLSGAPTETDERAALIKEVLRQHRRKLQGTPDRTRKRLSERLNLKRYARRKTSELARRIRGGHPVPASKEVLGSRFSQSKLLDSIFPDRKEKWKIATKRPQGAVRELVFKDFNIVENPIGTMKAFRELAETECTSGAALIHFEDSYCSDIAPYLVLAEVWPHITPIFRGGKMSVPVQKVVTAVNLQRPLKMALNGVADLDDVWAFPLKQRRMSGRGRSPTIDAVPQAKEEVADQFCDTLDVWLGQETLDMELTQSGRAWFATIITELLDNAERHSDPTNEDTLTGNWSCAAFMARRKEDGGWVYRCHMGFLSVGATIAESLMIGPDRIVADVKRYINKHDRKGFTPEALATVYALQDGITRIHEAAANQRGGIGFQEVMKFVSKLADGNAEGTDPRLTVISGSTCIRLRRPYVSGTSSGLNKPRVIWFNPANDPGYPPDPDHVFDVGYRFAGTVVGISFVLDPEYLKAAVDEPDQSSRTDQ